MDRRHFDLLAQSIARGMSRREASRALTASGLSVLGLTATQLHPLSSQARRKTARRRKKGKQDQNQLCKRQTGPCEAFIADRCLEPDSGLCQELAACCARLESCQFAGLVSCLEEIGLELPIVT